MRVTLIALSLAAVVLVAGRVSSHADAAPSATKLVDRTLVCRTGKHGGARVLYVRAQTAFGEGKQLDWLAQATVATAGQPLPSKPNYRPTLAGLTAGWPVAPPLTSGGAGFSAALCKVTRSRVQLAARGLVGGAAGQFGDEYQCVVPQSVLVRVRASFRAPVDLALQRDYYSANARIVRGQLAVATLSGKPLVYAEVAETGGTARLHTSKGCG